MQMPRHQMPRHQMPRHQIRPAKLVGWNCPENLQTVLCDIISSQMPRHQMPCHQMPRHQMPRHQMPRQGSIRG